jgi:ribonuclease P protein subunit RPR2
MKDRLRKKKRDEAAELAAERIDILFNLAEKKALSGELDTADSLIKRACNIGMKFNVRIPKQYKQMYCRKCHAFLLQGKTSKTRINSKEKRVEVTCLKCERKAYTPYVAEVKEKRRNKS